MSDQNTPDNEARRLLASRVRDFRRFLDLADDGRDVWDDEDMPEDLGGLDYGLEWSKAITDHRAGTVTYVHVLMTGGPHDWAHTERNGPHRCGCPSTVAGPTDWIRDDLVSWLGLVETRKPARLTKAQLVARLRALAGSLPPRGVGGVGRGLAPTHPSPPFGGGAVAWLLAPGGEAMNDNDAVPTVGDVPPVDVKLIRLRNTVAEFTSAALAVGYALDGLPDGDPLRCKWGRVVHQWPRTGDAIRDDIDTREGKP